MKKTLIATAIAAVGFSGATLAAEANLPTFYGNIQLAVTHNNVDGGDSDLALNDNGTTIGVLHEHQVAPGITGFLKIELDHNFADDKAGSQGKTKLDEAYIGVKGDNFGKLWVGSDDSLYETTIDQIVNYYEVAARNIGGSYSTGEGDLIQYLTPSFGGLQLGAALQINGDGDQSGAAKSYPYQLAAIYSVDALTLAFAMDSNDGSTGYNSHVENDPNNENTYGVRVAYEMDALGLSFQYQTRKDVNDLMGVMGTYTLGKNVFALSYELAKADGAAKTGVTDKWDNIAVQALHNLSDNMYVYVEADFAGGDKGAYGVANKSNASTASVGATYYF
ncbi:MAG TPA: porin [Marinobacter sp.]|nr:porin [Marinobacter sp.]